MRSRIDKTRVALSIALPALFVTVSRTDAQRIGEGPRSIYQNGCKGITDLTSEAIDAAMAGDDEQPLAKSIEEFSKGQPIGFTNLLGGNWDGPMARLFGTTEIPTAVVVDPSGRVAFVGVGSDALRCALERLKELSLR